MLILGNCLDKLKELEADSVDSVVTDPPYELGFMGKSWDGSGIANNPDMWREVLRVLKPGGHLLSFSGTRTYHRQAVAIEDAGFEIRDMVEWVYGSGFPKSLNIGKAVDKLEGNERDFVESKRAVGFQQGVGDTKILGKGALEWDRTRGTSPWEGWGTALKPAHEPICLARKPLAEKTVAQNVLKYGTGGINIDKSRVGHNEPEKLTTRTAPKFNGQDYNNGKIYENKEGCGNLASANITGRFPANIIHDGSDEVVSEFPNSKSSGEYKKTGDWKNTGNGEIRTWDIGYDKLNKYAGDSGSASRFFKSFIYCAKASKSERDRGCEGMDTQQSVGGGGGIGDYLDDVNSASGKYGSEKAPAKNNHPTVKPLALMKYLIQMITPEGGVVLDPFAGSGSTLVAAKELGYDFIGIEMTEEYIPIIEARLNGVKDTLL
jgi:DNA modification methylase